MDTKLKTATQKILDLAEIEINGNDPWDIQIHDDRFYSRVLADGSLGLGESYMEGLWDCDKLDEFFYRVLKADLGKRVSKKGVIWNALKAKAVNMQSRGRAFDIGKSHYDIGNDLYKLMLDKRMVYTCGYWRDAENLDDAQESKLELTCRKIGLEPGMRVLDIGCGWGSFAKFAAEKYGAEVVGITVSKEQVELGNKLCDGLPVEIRFQDYRDVNEARMSASSEESKFDRVVSLGMFEHVGPKNYRTYMRKVSECLKDDGLFLLHTIGTEASGGGIDRWINKYIFPNSALPSVKQIADSSDGIFSLEDWHSFGTDYDKTLMAWHDNFSEGWDKIKDKYSGEFKRMWDYYLMSCAGSFRSEKNRLWQIVFSKSGDRVRYKSVR